MPAPIRVSPWSEDGRDGGRTMLVLAVAAEAPTRRLNHSLAAARCISRSQGRRLTVPENHLMLSLAGVEHRGDRPKQAARVRSGLSPGAPRGAPGARLGQPTRPPAA